jgi:hypothetical protein
MAANAPVTQYRMETIAAFELGQSFLRISTTQEHVRQGNSAVFLVSDTGGTEATTRGLNGLIPTSVDNNVQSTCTLTEWHDKRRRSDFDIFSSQGDGKRIMQSNTVKVLNRKIDAQIITELNTATNDTGAAAVASMNMVAKSQAILGNAEVDIEEEDSMFAIISPAYRGYLIQTTEFSSGDYVEVKPLVGPARRMFRWMGINWIVHPRLPGAGTNAEKCFMYHKSAIGHAANSTDLDVEGGYNGEDKYWWARASLYMGAKLLQNSGIVVMNHDGSAYVAS